MFPLSLVRVALTSDAFRKSPLVAALVDDVIQAVLQANVPAPRESSAEAPPGAPGVHASSPSYVDQLLAMPSDDSEPGATSPVGPDALP